MCKTYLTQNLPTVCTSFALILHFSPLLHMFCTYFTHFFHIDQIKHKKNHTLTAGIASFFVKKKSVRFRRSLVCRKSRGKNPNRPGIWIVSLT